MPINSYSKTFKMSVEKAGFDRKVTAKYLMELFQEVATENADELGFGYKKLLEIGQAWVINKIKFVFYKKVKVGDEITFTTWPLEPKHYTCDRDFEGYNQKGEKVFAGTSVWNLIDLEKRCLCQTKDVKKIKIDYPKKRALSSLEFNKFTFDVDSYKRMYAKRVRISDLDVNNHVNNTNYINYSVDCLDKTTYKKGISSFEIRFHRELLWGDQLEIFYKKDGKNNYVVGNKVSGEPVFSTLIEISD